MTLNGLEKNERLQKLIYSIFVFVFFLFFLGIIFWQTCYGTTVSISNFSVVVSG